MRTKRFLMFLGLSFLLGLLGVVHRHALTLWGVGVFLYGLHAAIKKDETTAVLTASYLVGLEVSLRMVSAALPWEFGKYASLFIIGVVVIQGNISKNKVPFVFAFLLLLPAIFLVDPVLAGMSWRKAVSFNLSGHLAILFFALYFYKRELSKEMLGKIVNVFIFGASTVLSIVLFKFPGRSAFENLGESSFAASGGFGPNQVSTILGAAFVILILAKVTHLRILKKESLIWPLGLVFLTFSVLTFSRGGTLSAIVAVLLAFILLLVYKPKDSSRAKWVVTFLIIGLCVGPALGKINEFTGGSFERRYGEIFESGGEKATSGRTKLIESDYQMFRDNFLFGVGVGNSKFLRESYSGRQIASHTEFSRIIGEHGLLGVCSLLLLIFLSVKKWLATKLPEEKIFHAALTVLAILTMFHSAMRLAMPSFFYSLALCSWKYQENLYKKRKI